LLIRFHRQRHPEASAEETLRYIEQRLAAEPAEQARDPDQTTPDGPLDFESTLWLHVLLALILRNMQRPA
jgi:hypothetical protein